MECTFCREILCRRGDRFPDFSKGGSLSGQSICSPVFFEPFLGVSPGHVLGGHGFFNGLFAITIALDVSPRGLKDVLLIFHDHVHLRILFVAPYFFTDFPKESIHLLSKIKNLEM